MNDEIIITDLYEAAREKERLSENITRDRWRVLDYETAKFSGKLLCVGANCYPQPITLDLFATGKFRIYLGLMQMRGAVSSIAFHFSDSEEIYHVNAQSTYDWTPLENMVECYFKTVELNGQSLVLSKPHDYLPHNSALAWIRLVRAEDERPKERCIAYHLDSDYFTDDEYPTPRSVAGRIDAFADGGAELIIQEGFADRTEEAPYVDAQLFPRAAKYQAFYDKKEDIENALIEKAHAIGSKIYAAYRIVAGEFTAPNDFGGSNLFFGDGYDSLNDCRCISRDGRVLGTRSYAYPEVRKNIIDRLMSFMKRGYDGLSLIFNRGTFVAFEKPICDEVYKRYGVDARRLPMSDFRYNSVAGSFVTEFMRELRRRLDGVFAERKGINVVVMFTPEDSQNNGFDVETWVNEGLVDSVSQGLMRVFEDLDGCFSDDGLVDLEKYKMALLERPTVKREFRATPENLDLIVAGAEKFMRICRGKADFYATLLWEAQTEEETIAIYERLNAIGAKSFISWNANHKAKVLSRINAEKFYVAGSREEYNAKKTSYIRTLSIGGTDISQFNPNWKG